MANNSIGAYAQGGSNDIGAYEYAAAASTALLADDLQMLMELTLPVLGQGMVLGSEEWWAYRRKQYRSRLRKGWWEEFPELKKRQRKLKNKSRRISLRGTKLR